MEGERHLLSNHADIEATINNAIEHFLYEESFREEQKICLNLVRRGQDVFAILPTGSVLTDACARAEDGSTCAWVDQKTLILLSD